MEYTPNNVRRGEEMARIERKEYLDWLIRWSGQRVIKVVSGVRRCGKSTLLEMFREYLLEQGVNPQQILSFNFEDIELEHLTEYRALYQAIQSALSPDKMNYIFLDEIQHVSRFEKAIDSLFLKSNCDIYITGSNAYLLSGELATLLSGRYVELKMLPLSFDEFCRGVPDSVRRLPKTEKFNRYVEIGSFPFIAQFADKEREAKEYLRDIYNSVLLKDVVTRLKIADIQNLENLSKFLFHNIGNRASVRKIADTLKSQGKGVDQKTVEKYMRGLIDGLLLYEARRYNIKGRQHLTTQSKYYAVDIGLRNLLVRGQEADHGYVLENLVYLELIRRGYETFVGQLDDGEVDFVTKTPDGTAYFQVATSALNENVLQRELFPLRKIVDNYPKYLLTLDEAFASADYQGIRKMNVIDWLLGD